MPETLTQLPPPPGPGYRPNKEELRTLQQGPHEFILTVARTYGGIVRYPVGPLPVYLVTEPEYVRHVLQDNNKAYNKQTFQYKLLSSITGQGLLTSDGDFWLKQRRLAQPAFRRQHVSGFTTIMADAVESMLARWESYARRGEPLDIAAEMMHVALQIVAKAMFGADVGDQADGVAQATLTVLDHIIARARTFGLTPTFLPTAANRQFWQAMKLLNNTVNRTITDRRNAGPAQDLLSNLMQAQDAETGHRMSDENLRDEVMTMLIAGHETVASAMAWTWYLLGEHPEKEAELHAELAQELGGRTPTDADLPNLCYTDMVFSEALRLYPPAWIITRKALEDDAIGGYHIPANSLVVTSPYVTHRLEAYWPQPERFEPERFVPAASAARPRFAYYPFGGGPRLCIGNNFAQVEAAMVISMVAQRYTLRLVPGHPVEVEPGVTLRPKHGLMMTVQRREPSPVDRPLDFALAGA
jgi:cytochrome P450